MGLLDNVLSYVDSKKRVAKRGLLDMVENPSQWAGMQSDRIQEDRYGGAENAQAMKQYLSKKPYDKVAKGKAEDALRNAAVNESLGAITVWHGSPHKFDKFDMSKIGTGEGAQAYGHGLYMADNPDVARYYSAKLSGSLGQPLPVQFQHESGDWFSKNGSEYLMNGKPIPKQEYGDAYKKALDEFSKKDKGALYKADIPDEAVARFLDWDKPLSQQAPEVQSAVRKLATHAPEGGMYRESMAPYEFGNLTGQQVERIFASDIAAGGNGQANKTFSMLANEYGIPGIRYLDGGSRGQQAGTSNFVLFDDQLPRILEVNGQATGAKPWGAGEWGGLLGKSEPKLTEFEQRHLTAQKNAALPVEQGGLGLPVDNTAMDRAMALGHKPVDGEDFYGGNHRPPMSDSGAPAHDLTGGGNIYPDDVYSSNAARYYGSGEASDSALFRKLQALKGKPEEKVRVFRAVPSDVMEQQGNMMHHGDWVTPNRQYAVDHGEGALNGDYRIQASDYPAKSLFTNGDSPYEFGIDKSQLFADGPASIPLMISNQHSVADRSRFAAFDPMRRHEADLLGNATPEFMSLLAGGGLLGLGGYSLLDQQ